MAAVLESQGSKAAKGVEESSSVNQIQTADVERQATTDSERSRQGKRQSKSKTRPKSNLSRTRGGEGELGDGDPDDQMPVFPQKYTMRRGLSPYWRTRRGHLTIFAIILLFVGAIVGGVVGGVMGNRDQARRDEAKSAANATSSAAVGTQTGMSARELPVEPTPAFVNRGAALG